MPTPEEIKQSAEEARRLWPASFAGEYDGRPKILQADVDALKARLRALDVFRANSLSRAWTKVKI